MAIFKKKKTHLCYWRKNKTKTQPAMKRGCRGGFQRSTMTNLLKVWSVAHNNDRIEVLMQRFVNFLIQPFHLHRDICLFWSCFAYGRWVDMCFSYGCMLNVFLQRRPGMPLGPRRYVRLQHLFDLRKSNTNDFPYWKFRINTFFFSWELSGT